MAQLQADFDISVASGCAPLQVNFTNKTTGNTQPVTYEWNLGNGSISTLTNPGATYTTGNVYNVTLTATESGIKSTISKNVTVYKNPIVGFAVNQPAGCAPLDAKFSSRSSAGDGTIANYLWDFGDGNTATGADQKEVRHLYTAAQKPAISLTVVNSFGCVSSLTQNTLLQVYNTVVASFTPSAVQVCNAGDPITFTNTTTGDDPLTYKWDFGNGVTSNQQSPAYGYPQAGIYTVKMSATNVIGCASNARSINVNIGNFTADFSLPAARCVNQPTLLTNRSTRPYDSTRWQVNGVTVPSDAFGNLLYRFPVSDSFTVTLTSFYKSCQRTVTKRIFIGNLPVLKGFLVDNANNCNLPITFRFTDTTATAVKWQWRYLRNTTPFDTLKTTTRTYADSGTDRIGLTVTNQYGCTAVISQVISFYTPKLAIGIKSSTSAPQSPNRGCPGLKVKFTTTPAKEIIKFSWDFGDGSPLATISEPSHTYNALGSYAVKLQYETKNGCKGTIEYDSIFVNNIAPFDFAVSPTGTICGNSTTTFTPTVQLPNRDYIWLIDKVQVLYSLTPVPLKYKFDKPGFHTVSLVMASGTCRDTVTKVNYVEVLPPFPKIDTAINTCNGNRGTVTFIDSTHDANNWLWDFGDGKTSAYNTYVNSLSHTYAASGTYLVTLTTTIGQCTVTDSLRVNVLLKQKPLLNAAATNVCSSDTFNLNLAGFEVNPVTENPVPYAITALQFGDLSVSKASINTGNWQTGFNAPVWGLESGKQNLRIITRSAFFNCDDTTNFIALQTEGPIAGLNFKPVKCLNQFITLNDASNISAGDKLAEWKWSFGDGTDTVTSNGNPVTHYYSSPGNYTVALQVKDVAGCTSKTPADSTFAIQLSGPRSQFDVSATSVLVNSAVDFTNTSLFTENSTLRWQFPNNVQLTEQNPQYIFDKEGSFVISLITRNTVTGCTDTASQTIAVKRLQSTYTTEVKYTGQNSCPPLLATFTNQSINVQRIKWDFGDGSTAGNESVVSHIYTSAGVFKVTLYTYDALGRVDSNVQIVDVKGPYAVLRTDRQSGCNTLPIRLSADTINTKSFKWDFGDGNIINGTDTFITHIYSRPGFYAPAMVLEDVNGCVATSQLQARIIVDSLSGTMAVDGSAIVCDSSLVRFTSKLSAYSSINLNSPVKYSWTSTAHPADTLRTANAQWVFNQTGKYNIHLTGSTAYGCTVDFDQPLEVRQNYNAVIRGPLVACVGTPVSFQGSVSPGVTGIAYNWNLGDNNVSNLQNPAPVVYRTAGFRLVSLVADAGYCPDTTTVQLDVKALPVINLRSASTNVCIGNADTLFANKYQRITWTPAPQTLLNGNFTAVIKPLTTTTYTAFVTDSFGCNSTDSITVQVTDKLKISTESYVFTCAGTGVQLTATGADRYQWTGGNGFTSSSQSPFFTPLASQTIKVVGYDAFNCFADSALVSVNVGKLPTAALGPDKTIVAGETISLQGQYSPDVVQWRWNPADYLTCNNCASPLASPKREILYVVTATNGQGCSAKDSIRIEMLCDKNLVWIPNAFTPNGDNLNDRFHINGSGITIKRLAIFDRWGKLMFDKANVDPFDTSSGWDGRYKSEPQPTGGYVYMIEVVCNSSGERFSFKGNFTLIR